MPRAAASASFRPDPWPRRWCFGFQHVARACDHQAVSRPSVTISIAFSFCRYCIGGAILGKLDILPRN